MCEKNWFSTDMKTSSTKHENPPPPLCYKMVGAYEVVIYHKLRIQ